jgi:signal transduction histidine kinase
MIAETWQRYRDTLDCLLEGFQIIAYDWTYLYVNPAAAAHGRRTPADLVGRRMWEAYPGIEETPLFATMNRCMLERTPTSFENPFTFPDHTTRWFEIRIEPVPEGLCVHSVDIQARKEAETALREQESIATLGQMAAVVAHEMKNPLAGLSGALQVLKSRRPEDHPDVPVFDEMLVCIGSLDRLIRDLLVFARPMQIEAAPVSIAQVIRDALLLVTNDALLAGHSVNLAIDDPAPVVHGDRELLKSVFRNLFLNAGRAMKQPGRIDVRAMGSATACRVTVGDTGSGVPPALAGRIFEPFVTGTKGGTGLGLSISRRIMRLHGGDLELVPSDATGATFLVTVPLARTGDGGTSGEGPRSE